MKNHINELKYSLKEILAEVDEERRESALAHELVDQDEIKKLFKKKPRKRRVQKK